MKDERVYLGHIRDAIDDIVSYAAVGREAFLLDLALVWVVVDRNLPTLATAVTSLLADDRA